MPAVREFIRETGERGTYRHDTIVSLAGTFVRLGWPVEQAAKVLAHRSSALSTARARRPLVGGKAAGGVALFS
ncbi:hypothetical protein SAMN05444161_2751 [Rhizobiales bacterium GAS191]|nr:hypothetical protein SAMN05444161_2751 [Rhizobiales bacterium GAS191]